MVYFAPFPHSLDDSSDVMGGVTAQLEGPEAAAQDVTLVVLSIVVRADQRQLGAGEQRLDAEYLLHSCSRGWTQCTARRSSAASDTPWLGSLLPSIHICLRWHFQKPTPNLPPMSCCAGRMLLQALHEQALRDGLQRLATDVAANNQPAISFFHELGYSSKPSTGKTIELTLELGKTV